MNQMILSNIRQRIQRPGKPNKRKTLGKGVDQRLSGIPHAQICSCMSLSLGFTSAQATDGTEGDQLPHFQIQRSSGVEISKTVGGEVVLDVF